MEDERCCGTGTCIINAEGLCWCGQKWNGTTMCFPEDDRRHASDVTHAVVSPSQASGSQATSPTANPSGVSARERPVS